MSNHLNRRGVTAGIGATLVSPALVSASAAFAASGEPIKIGFSMAQTGSLAGAGSRHYSAPRFGKQIPMPKAA
jgi:hypothetical protein